MNERHDIIVDIFVFTVAIISAVTTFIILYLLCKHNKLRALVANLALRKVKEVSTTATKQDTNNACDCTSQFYIVLALSVSITGLLIFAVLQVRKIKLCRGKLFSNAVKIMLCSIHLFKITGILTPEKVKLNKHYIWDILEVGWKEVKVMFNGKMINLPKSVTIKFPDKFKVRHMMRSQHLLFHLI